MQRKMKVRKEGRKKTAYGRKEGRKHESTEGRKEENSL
jgi:hypothetical protein